MLDISNGKLIFSIKALYRVRSRSLGSFFLYNIESETSVQTPRLLPKPQTLQLIKTTRFWPMRTRALSSHIRAWDLTYPRSRIDIYRKIWLALLRPSVRKGEKRNVDRERLLPNTTEPDQPYPPDISMNSSRLYIYRGSGSKSHYLPSQEPRKRYLHGRTYLYRGPRIC